MSLLNAENPSLYELFEQAGIELLWHPSLSERGGRALIELLQSIVAGDTRLDILCLEGSVMKGPNGTGKFHLLSGTDTPMFEWLEKLAGVADVVLAVGSCAAFGGITAAGDNIGEAIGLQYDGEQPGGLLPQTWRSRGELPVINVAGCPVHPGWVTDSLLLIADRQMQGDQIDEYQRPRLYTDHLVHHGCPRNEYYEFKASAEKPSDQGCMMENMGCLGTQARADCNIRPWNGSGSCLKGGYACINCTAPGFEEPGHAFSETPKVAGIPVGLPTDMPKAWFVALASLAKAATPERLRQNATSERLIYPPAHTSTKGRDKS
ncbi:HupU protein [Exilibacterium tricleocarpae]|uniref:hydrogenase (acceptor) n=2 Tax=Exilibacterium tricleocarpae TaxID=2591008 RepID=A0A545TFY1_9GAMM|nr:HupU protein [Exilibacterium tricleocarpae]